MVRAGRHRERAVFQRLVADEVDEFGNIFTGWKDFVSRFGDMQERTARERFSGGTLADVGGAVLRVRMDSMTKTITSADRVVMRNHTWAIKDVVQVDAKGTVLEFFLERGVAS